MSVISPASLAFPKTKVLEQIRQSLNEIADDTILLQPDRPDWEPLLDSLRVVSVVIALEAMLDMSIPPDKVVQKGGYMSVEQAVDDIVARVSDLWANRKPSRKRP